MALRSGRWVCYGHALPNDILQFERPRSSGCRMSGPVAQILQCPRPVGIEGGAGAEARCRQRQGNDAHRAHDCRRAVHSDCQFDRTGSTITNIVATAAPAALGGVTQVGKRPAALNTELLGCRSRCSGGSCPPHAAKGIALNATNQQ